MEAAIFDNKLPAPSEVQQKYLLHFYFHMYVYFSHTPCSNSSRHVYYVCIP